MTVLGIDDDPAQLERLSLIFEHTEYPEITFLRSETMKEGLELFRTNMIDMVISDLYLPEGSGLEILEIVKKTNPMIPVIVMTAFSDAREAVDILKSGADDYLVKPINPEELEKLVVRTHEKDLLIKESFLPSVNNTEKSPEFSGIIYKGSGMASVMQTAARAAESDATIVISGESGTGKELLAHFIHDRSLRKDGPFVAVNISALPESLAESELFGHKKGSYTGADADRIGRFELADGGTLFIDEIGDVSQNLQVKLLRAIQFGIIERLGENTQRKLNVRIIAATNSNLYELVKQGKFRKDLFYRVNVINLILPPLRERKEDIPDLIRHFIGIFNHRNHRSVEGLSREAMNKLMKHDFPGNVRELENIIERAVVLCRGNTILERDLPPMDSRQDPLLSSYEELMGSYERSLIDQALAESRGNKSAAARRLGITERHLRSRLERLYPKQS